MSSPWHNVDTLGGLFDGGLALVAAPRSAPQEFTGCPVPIRAAARWQLFPPPPRVPTRPARLLTTGRARGDGAIHQGLAGRTRSSAGAHAEAARSRLAEIEESPGIVLYTLLDDGAVASAEKDTAAS